MTTDARQDEAETPFLREVALAFPGARLRVAGDHVLLETASALAVVSSAPIGGGSLRARRFFCARAAGVRRDPMTWIERRATEVGVARPFVGLAAAMGLDGTTVVEREEDGVAALAVAMPGMAAESISLFVLVDAQLLPGAVIDGVVAATEGRAAALAESGREATATSAAGIVVGVTMRGTLRPYSGTNVIGALIQDVTRTASAQLLNPTPAPQRRR